MRKEEHARKYGLEIQADKRDPAGAVEAKKLPEPVSESKEAHAPEEQRNSLSAPDHEHHDDTNDVVVEAGEDMVIY